MLHARRRVAATWGAPTDSSWGAGRVRHRTGARTKKTLQKPEGCVDKRAQKGGRRTPVAGTAPYSIAAAAAAPAQNGAARPSSRLPIIPPEDGGAAGKSKSITRHSFFSWPRTSPTTTTTTTTREIIGAWYLEVQCRT